MRQLILRFIRCSIGIVGIALVYLPTLQADEDLPGGPFPGSDQVLVAADSHPTNPSQGNIIQSATKAGGLTMFLKAVEAAGLTDTLEGKGPFTIFAPNDTAFSKISESTLSSLIANQTQLKQIVLYHVVPGEYSAKDLTNLSHLMSQEGAALNFSSPTNGSIKINDMSTVVQPDIQASNGVIHVIDTVLTMPGESS